MQAKLLDSLKLPPSWVRFFILTVLALGLFFRFANLDAKFFWTDETLTSLLISGHTRQELLQHVGNGEIRSAADFQQQFQGPTEQRGVTDTVKALATDSPEHPPLYYMLVSLWARVFGDSVTAIRSLSAVISLLTLPAMYWLCLELFGAGWVPWLAVAIAAVSPLQILYAQESREYSLWTLTTLISCALLLRSLRVKTVASWVMYAIVAGLQLNTYPFSLYTLVGHGIYILLTSGFKLTKSLVAYALAFATGILLFTPWILVILSKLPEIQHRNKWSAGQVGIVHLAQRWVFNLSQVFVDLVFYSTASLKQLLPYMPFILGIVGLVVYSLYFLWRHASRQAWIFVLVLIGTTALLLIAQDLIGGGVRSATSRYLTPCYIGAQISLAYLLATQIASTQNWQQKFWQAMMVLVISLGVVSCAISAQAETWWNKGKLSWDYLKTEEILESKSRPLLMLGTSSPVPDCSGFLIFSHILKPETQMMLLRMNQPRLPEVAKDFSDIFLFDDPIDQPETALGIKLLKEQGYTVETIHEGYVKTLWHLKQR